MWAKKLAKPLSFFSHSSVISIDLWKRLWAYIRWCCYCAQWNNVLIYWIRWEGEGQFLVHQWETPLCRFIFAVISLHLGVIRSTNVERCHHHFSITDCSNLAFCQCPFWKFVNVISTAALSPPPSSVEFILAPQIRIPPYFQCKNACGWCALNLLSSILAHCVRM